MIISSNYLFQHAIKLMKPSNLANGSPTLNVNVFIIAQCYNYGLTNYCIDAYYFDC